VHDNDRMTETDHPLAADEVGLLAGLTSTRAIRRYTDEPVPEAALRDMFFAATRAPSGSNRQPFRFVVLTDSPVAAQAKRLVAASARRIWDAKAQGDGYLRGSGAVEGSPKARMRRTMTDYVASLETVPVLVFPLLVRYREPSLIEGAHVYPACQNLLLAARALGYGGVFTGFHHHAEPALRTMLALPDEVQIAGTITIGRPAGRHGPVRRRPLGELVYSNGWEQPAPWAVDPPGTRHTAAGPPVRPSGMPSETPPGTSSARQEGRHDRAQAGDVAEQEVTAVRQDEQLA